MAWQLAPYLRAPRVSNSQALATRTASSPQWAFLNRLRIMDIPLDAAHANAAAEIHEQAKVSVADAHIGAVVQLSPNAEITVLTSDPADIRRVAGSRPVTAVAI